MFTVTFFEDIYAKSLRAETFTTLEELGGVIVDTHAPTKEALPLLKFGRFGTVRTPAPNNCLRTDQNVLMTTGIEGDHDAGTMPFQEAVDRLEAAGFAFLIYTTPSHTPGKPRWRVLAQLSKEVTPAERARLMTWLNGILGGVLSRESWGISQAFYYGQVDGAPSFELHVGFAERSIDEADFEAIAQPYRPAPGAAAGQGSKGATPDFDDMDETELLAVIASGAHYWGPAKRLLMMWAQQGVGIPDAESNLAAAFDAVPQANRGKKWGKNRKSIPRWVRDVYKRLAKKQSTPLKALVTYLTDDPLWKGAVRYNDFAQTIEVCDPFPPQPGQVMGRYRALREPGDILRTLIQVQDNGFPRVTQGAVWNALILAAEDRTYHPVRDYLGKPVWNDEPRVCRLFLDYFPGEVPEPADDTERVEWERLQAAGKLTPADRMVAYLEKIGTCYMVSLVARAFKPGCKVDTLPVLISPEAFNKSQGFRALCLEEAWFTDDVSPDLMDRDTKDSLRGKWIIELAEFPHARKDATRFKMFASRQVDRFRRPYDRAPYDWPRQCGFAATANELELISVTGNRRVWPFWLAGPVNVAAIERDRDQLWAEAVHLYRNNYPWWLPPEIEAIAGELQDAFVEADEWDELILDFLDRQYPVNPRDKLRPPFTLRAVLKGIGFCFIPGGSNFATKPDETRVSRRLQRLGYRPSPHRSRRTGRERVWVATRKN